MATKSQFFLLLLLTFLSSCSIVKILNVLNGGEVAKRHFHKKVDFERRLGLIIVPVTIEGEQYDFLLDTGAPTVVSTELAAKLNLPILAEQQAPNNQYPRKDISP